MSGRNSRLNLSAPTPATAASNSASASSDITPDGFFQVCAQNDASAHHFHWTMESVASFSTSASSNLTPDGFFGYAGKHAAYVAEVILAL